MKTDLYSTSKHHRECTRWRAAKANPGIRFAENEVRGYARVDLKEGGMTVAFRGLADARDVASPVSTIARFDVEAGRAGIANTASS